MTSSHPLVLVVDDDPLVLATLVIHIRRRGFSVMQASDGTEALRCCERTRPDIAVIDFRLPGMSGIELIRKLRELADIPCVLLTGEDDPATAAEASEAGAAAYLVKPTDTARLTAILNATLETHRPPHA